MIRALHLATRVNVSVAAIRRPGAVSSNRPSSGRKGWLCIDSVGREFLGLDRSGAQGRRTHAAALEIAAQQGPRTALMTIGGTTIVHQQQRSMPRTSMTCRREGPPLAREGRGPIAVEPTSWRASEPGPGVLVRSIAGDARSHDTNTGRSETAITAAGRFVDAAPDFARAAAATPTRRCAPADHGCPHRAWQPPRPVHVAPAKVPVRSSRVRCTRRRSRAPGSASDARPRRQQARRPPRRGARHRDAARHRRHDRWRLPAAGAGRGQGPEQGRQHLCDRQAADGPAGHGLPDREAHGDPRGRRHCARQSHVP